MDVLASLKSSLPVLSTGAKQQWVGAVPTVTLQCFGYTLVVTSEGEVGGAVAVA